MKRILKIITSAIISTLLWNIGNTHTNLYFYTVRFLCPILGVYMLYQMIRIISDIPAVKKFLHLILRKFKPAASKLHGLWLRFGKYLYGWSRSSITGVSIKFRRLKDISKITGYFDQYYKYGNKSTTEVNELIPIKWRRFQTDSERVRFLYGKYIMTNRKKKGFSCSYTPNELQKHWGADDYNKILIPAYNKARYDETADIPKETLEKLNIRK